MGSNKNATSDFSHVEQLLQQLKGSFLDELAERCNELELLSLALANKGGAQDNYDELYRKVHSLKGIAGTHGVPVISTICHHFEDHLNVLEDDFGNIDDDFIDACLAYVDLIASTAREAMKADPNYTETEKRLEKIRQELLEDNLAVLIVESSPLMVKVYQSALSKLSVQTIIVSDGLQALERLLQERFDFVIMGNALKTLNGVALISALKASESINSGIHTIMITSTTNIRFPTGVEPDYLIHRTSELAKKLAVVVGELVSAK